MSWVAVACSVPSAAIGGLNKYIPLEHHTFGQCSYCNRLPDTNQTTSNCTSCGAPPPRSTTPTTMNYSNHDSRNSQEERLRRIKANEEEDHKRRKRQDEDDRLWAQSTNIAMGDMLGTGIPGGIDMDMTTPL